MKMSIWQKKYHRMSLICHWNVVVWPVVCTRRRQMKPNGEKGFPQGVEKSVESFGHFGRIHKKALWNQAFSSKTDACGKIRLFPCHAYGIPVEKWWKLCFFGTKEFVYDDKSISTTTKIWHFRSFFRKTEKILQKKQKKVIFHAWGGEPHQA